MYHDVCGTLNGRRLEDGSLLYGCTCNLSVDIGAADLDFDASFPAAAFEDVEFCVRARKRGISLVYTPTAVVAHHYTGGLWGLYRQFRRYGMYESQVGLLAWLPAQSLAGHCHACHFARPGLTGVCDTMRRCASAIQST
jgi:hypothetical protein